MPWANTWKPETLTTYWTIRVNRQVTWQQKQTDCPTFRNDHKPQTTVSTVADGMQQIAHCPMPTLLFIWCRACVNLVATGSSSAPGIIIISDDPQSETGLVRTGETGHCGAGDDVIRCGNANNANLYGWRLYRAIQKKCTIWNVYYRSMKNIIVLKWTPLESRHLAFLNKACANFIAQL